jgi:hypothetical protein
MLGDTPRAMRALERALAISEAIPATRWAAGAQADLDAVTTMQQR